MDKSFSKTAVTALCSTIAERFGLKHLGCVEFVPCFRKRYKIDSDKIIYVCWDKKTGELLKVGQSTNWRNRFVCYSYRDKTKEPVFEMFEASSWKHQDEAEYDVRHMLEELGCKLLWDNTNERLRRRGITL